MQMGKYSMEIVRIISEMEKEYIPIWMELNAKVDGHGIKWMDMK